MAARVRCVGDRRSGFLRPPVSRPGLCGRYPPRYSVRTIVETGVATWLHALPADVHDEVMGLVGSYKRQGTLIFLSNLSEEDMSEVKNKFIALCAL